MKSIRRVLILNVTALLVVALGSVAALVYRITQDALSEKQRSAGELVDLQFAEQRDEALLTQARALAGEAQSQFDPVKFRQYFEAAPFGAYALTFGANSHITVPLWLAERIPGPLSFRLNGLLATDIKLNESEASTHGYVQVDSDWGNIWRSKALAGPNLPLDVSQFQTEEKFQWFFDEIEINEGVKARRVRLKAPLTRTRVLVQAQEPQPEKASLGVAAGLRPDPFRPNRYIGPPWYYDPRGQGPGPGSGMSKRPPFGIGSRPPSPSPPPPPLSNFFGGNYQPTLYIQVAWDSTTSDPKLLELESRRKLQHAELDADHERSLRHVEKRLLWIGLGTFAIVVVGGWLLVGVGLSPLKRLSDAVSQVSAKDFKLPLEPRELPREVSPVALRFQQTLQDLQAAFAREKRSSADISHELRTPLAALTTTLEVALRKPRSNEEYRQTIVDSRQIARQMSRLVERMLMLAWLDAGADVIRPCVVEIDELVDGCAAIGKPLAEAQGLKFQVNAEHPLTVNTDPDKVREVVMNLLHNAIEYNRPGGEVEITARSSPGGIVLVVRDTGIGIAAEFQDKIFERFYRGDPSRNATGVHAGLGLAIVKEYVDRLGGRLSIESQLGSGSSFRVEIPGGTLTGING